MNLEYYYNLQLQNYISYIIIILLLFCLLGIMSYSFKSKKETMEESKYVTVKKVILILSVILLGYFLYFSYGFLSLKSQMEQPSTSYYSFQEEPNIYNRNNSKASQNYI